MRISCGLKTYIWKVAKSSDGGGAKNQILVAFSGIPQGSVLGPVLFLVCINDIATHVYYKINQFADDCALHHEITSAEGTIACKKTWKGPASGAVIGIWTSMLLNATY